MWPESQRNRAPPTNHTFAFFLWEPEPLRFFLVPCDFLGGGGGSFYAGYVIFYIKNRAYVRAQVSHVQLPHSLQYCHHVHQSNSRKCLGPYRASIVPSSPTGTLIRWSFSGWGNWGAVAGAFTTVSWRPDDCVRAGRAWRGYRTLTCLEEFCENRRRNVDGCGKVVIGTVVERRSV